MECGHRIVAKMAKDLSTTKIIFEITGCLTWKQGDMGNKLTQGFKLTLKKPVNLLVQ